MAGIALGVAIMIYGIYAMAVEGDFSAFIYITGGSVISALAAGVFSKALPDGASSKEDCEK